MTNALRHLLEDRAIFKIVGILLVWVASIALFYDASQNPRSLLRRTAADYVAWLDRRFRSMLMVRRGTFIAWSQGCGVISLSVLAIWLGSRAALAGVVAALVVPPLVVRYLVRRRLNRLAPQVHGFALALANSLKTTASIGEAIWVTVALTPAPLREELEIALKEVKVGSSVEDALLSMSARAESGALDSVVSALLIGRQTGGDLPRILEGTSSSLRELLRLEEAQRAISRETMTALSVAAVTTFGIFVLVVSIPMFSSLLLTTVKGRVILAQCAVVYVFMLVIGFRMTRTDV